MEKIIFFSNFFSIFFRRHYVCAHCEHVSWNVPNHIFFWKFIITRLQWYQNHWKNSSELRDWSIQRFFARLCYFVQKRCFWYMSFFAKKCSSLGIGRVVYQKFRCKSLSVWYIRLWKFQCQCSMQCEVRSKTFWSFFFHHGSAAEVQQTVHHSEFLGS